MVGTIVVGTRCFGVLNLFCWDRIQVADWLRVNKESEQK